jgi:hypothetical protein
MTELEKHSPSTGKNLQQTEQVCAETGEGVILIKDRRTGEVIGFERLYYRPDAADQVGTVETIGITS